MYLTDRQKYLLFFQAMGKKRAEEMSSESITSEMLIHNGVKIMHVFAAGLSLQWLHDIGFTTCASLKQHLDMDSLFLADKKIAMQALTAYGREDVLSTFLTEAVDAVALVGTSACKILEISSQELLRVCEGSRVEAISVLNELCQASACIKGITLDNLLVCNITKADLLCLGFNRASLKSTFSATDRQLQFMGFNG